jgi:hypothetical protein
VLIVAGEYNVFNDESAGVILTQPYLATQEDYNLSLPGVNYGFIAPVSLPTTAAGVSATLFAAYSAVVVHQEAEGEFRYLAEIWKSETGMLSRVDKRCMHPAYQKIIAMGESAIPFILQDLRDTQDSWFWALTIIAGEDAIPDDTPDDTDSLTEAWLSWGRANGYDI